MKLELIAFNIESCKLIESTRASRVELCASPGEGGTTPSYGMIKAARKILSKELYPIIRPRGGDFLYDDDGFEAMLEDISICRSLGCDGVVIGSLNNNGSINLTHTRKLVEHSYPMGVTFHRAFDRTADAVSALENLIDCGCERVLTSGLFPAVNEGIPNLRQLNDIAGDRIIIMPGSGVRASNLEKLVRETGCTEFHSSARINSPGNMSYKNSNMNEDLQFPVLEMPEVEKMCDILGL